MKESLENILGMKLNASTQMHEDFHITEGYIIIKNWAARHSKFVEFDPFSGYAFIENSNFYICLRHNVDDKNRPIYSFSISILDDDLLEDDGTYDDETMTTDWYFTIEDALSELKKKMKPLQQISNLGK